ncbi:MAG: hypothetical protein C0404_04525 [Verrucomicrobia bacterium]|nr:hypothetical protein [Verrucomicrobiota bacterium]
MISETDKAMIVELSRKYGVRRVLLFGSAARQSGESRDIDLAVEGLAADQFFKFYGELIRQLSKPVDLVALERKTMFTTLISREGVPLYG